MIHGFHHCILEWVHYTGTVGHPGYWRLILFCEHHRGLLNIASGIRPQSALTQVTTIIGFIAIAVAITAVFTKKWALLPVAGAVTIVSESLNREWIYVGFTSLITVVLATWQIHDWQRDRRKARHEAQS